MVAHDTHLLLCLLDEVLAGGHTNLIDDLVTDQHILHSPEGDLYGPEGLRLAVMEYRTGFPDLRIARRGMVSVGEIVACRFTLCGTHLGPFQGIPATGKAVEAAGTMIQRIERDRLAESWFRLEGLGVTG